MLEGSMSDLIWSE